MTRPVRRPSTAGAVTAAALLALLGAVVACQPAPSVPTSGPGDVHRPGAAASAYTVLQMNLCLSGLADCFPAAEYPNVVDEAAAQIQATDPDAVTMNEVCRSDGVRIARRTAYRIRFVPVHYAAAPLPCIEPGSRGLFGLAVLTKQPIVRSESEPFVAQTELEERRWLCVSTRDRVEVCTAHLEPPDTTDAETTNEAQCAELAAVLTRDASRSILFGGDVNRRDSCAPVGSWTRTDAASDRSPGVQHVYGSRTFEKPVAEVLPLGFSDHDLLLVSARLGAEGAIRG
jgi:endonuclease/exonuclease/phosphatase (EEP) superfamily protein YafD